MKIFTLILSSLFILIGIFLIFNPDLLFNYIAENSASIELYISAIIARLIIGLLLINVATESRFPKAFKILGMISLLAAIVLILIGWESFQNIMNSILPPLKPYGSFAGVFSLALGAFIFYALLANKNLKN